MTSPPRGLRRLTSVDAALMAAIVFWGLLQLGPELGHHAIWGFDESFHQVVTRHTFEHPLRPSLYDDPVHDSTDMYWGAREWLIKPPGVFWFGAAMMHFVGTEPLAFRLAGLFGQLVAALTIYLLASALARRLWAFVASVGFLSLPLGWTLTQGRFIGDELDLLLSGCICLAVLALVRAIDTDSSRWAAVSGAFTGAAILVKSVLGLTPLGVAGCMWLLRRLGFSPGPRLRSVAVMVGAMLLVVLPWNLYAAQKWPEKYLIANGDVLLHLLNRVAAAKAPQWVRPVDAVFNEVNHDTYNPVPHAVPVVAGVWLVVRALRRREPITIAASLWLWATWLGHSVAAVKMHSHLWNSTVAGFVGLALALDALWAAPVLTATIAASLTTPLWVAHVPAFVRLREALPVAFLQSRTLAGFVEGTVAALLALVVAVAAKRWAPARAVRVGTQMLAVGSAASLCWLLTMSAPLKLSEFAAAARPMSEVTYSRVVGRALDKQAAYPAILMLDIDQPPTDQIEQHNLMFWSNRIAGVGRDPVDYPQRGVHPYLVSPAAEPYRPMDVPAYAWLRAYDLLQPQSEPQPLPAGVQPLDLTVGSMRVVGVARGPSAEFIDHYALYVRSQGAPPQGLDVTFVTKYGRQSKRVEPEASLRNRQRLASAEWFVLPVIGPRAAEVEAIELGPAPAHRVALKPN